MSLRGMDVERVEHLASQLELQANAIDVLSSSWWTAPSTH